MRIRYWIRTYGCTLNAYDSELMIQKMNDEGYVRVRNIDEADVAIINTCGVKDATEKRIINLIKGIKKPLVVGGCIATGNKELVRKFCKNSVIIHTGCVQNICDAVRDALHGVVSEYADCNNKIRMNYEPKEIVYNIGVSEGCASNCTYCFTKLARPTLKSMRIGEIIKRIKHANEKGVKEVRLTAQDMGAYGMERGINLGDMLAKIAELNVNLKVRVGMMNPKHLINMMEVIDIIKENDMFYKFYHLPQQSGSDFVLKDMNRGNSVDEFKHIIREIRKDKLANVMTDIIVGFPGESEQDFESSVKMIKYAKPDTTNVSKYSARPKTRAAKMKQVDRLEINRRSAKLSKVCDAISKQRNEMWVGKTCDITMFERLRGSAGRNAYYKQVIVEDDLPLGASIKDVKIVGAGIAYIKGKISQRNQHS